MFYQSRTKLTEIIRWYGDFKDTVLNPVSILVEYVGYLLSLSVIRYVVGDDKVEQLRFHF